MTPPDANDPPTAPAAILKAVAAAGPGPWFPADYAAAAGVPRDSLYEPIADLVRAGRLRVVDWVKGRGQGYATAVVDADETPLPRTRSVADDPPRQRGPLTTFDRGELARSAVLSPRPAVVAPAVMLAVGIWYAVGLALAVIRGTGLEYLKGTDVETVGRLGGMAGIDLVRGEWWRLATHGFAHYGLLHLVLNTLALGSLGPLVEAVWGRWRFALIYGMSALGGGCVAMAFQPEGRHAGASGAICGLLAAAIAWLVLYREHLPDGLVADWVRSLGFAAAATLAISFGPRVSWGGHLGGAVVGFAAAVLLNVVRPGLVRKRVMVPAAAAVAMIPVVYVAGLTMYTHTAADWVRLRDAAVSEKLAKIEWGRVNATYTAAVVSPTGKLPADVPRLKADADAAYQTALAVVVQDQGPFGQAALQYTLAVFILVGEMERAVETGEWAKAATTRKQAEAAWVALNKR